MSLFLDFALFAVIMVSLAIGAYRGFIRSFLSVLFWAGAAWVSFKQGQNASVYLESMIANEGIRLLAGYIGVFFLVLLFGAILNAMISSVIVTPGVVSVDRTLGMAFGILRGGVIVTLVIVVGSIELFTGEPWWEDSLIVQFTAPYVDLIRDSLTSAIAPDTPT